MRNAMEGILTTICVLPAAGGVYGSDIERTLEFKWVSLSEPNESNSEQSKDRDTGHGGKSKKLGEPNRRDFI